MGQVVFHDFPEAKVTYEFKNRGGTPFPPGFADAVNWQIELMATLAMTPEEFLFIQTLPGIRKTYAEWLMSYRYDPGEVVATQNGDTLSILIDGDWFRTIYWEVPLMAIVSELYFKMTGKTPDKFTYHRLVEKNRNMSEANCHWADFGTRRRFSQFSQNQVVYLSKDVRGFIGTSNVYLAMKHRVKPIGTSAHEMVMGISAKYGATLANKMWLVHWTNHFRGLNSIALTDTFTTDVFLRDFDSMYARLFDGVRQDSGDPYEWAHKMITHYDSLGIDSRTKKFVFSDGLDDTTFKNLTIEFRDCANIIGGIGTFLTNDCGHKALNMVIKLMTADFGVGPVDVVKLSDNPGKHNGSEAAIARVKAELGL